MHTHGWNASSSRIMSQMERNSEFAIRFLTPQLQMILPNTDVQLTIM